SGYLASSYEHTPSVTSGNAEPSVRTARPDAQVLLSPVMDERCYMPTAPCSPHLLPKPFCQPHSFKPSPRSFTAGGMKFNGEETSHRGQRPCELEVSMKMLMIVARDSTVKELEELLHANGITAYSVIHKVEGRGQTGIVGTFHYNVYTGST